MSHTHDSLYCIIPPTMLEKLLTSKKPGVADAALNTLLMSAELRSAREVRSLAGFASSSAKGRRTIFNLKTGTDLSAAEIVQTEDGNPSSDISAKQAFNALGTIRDFYKREFKRNSIDGRGMRLDAYVHYSIKYNNAFWDGQEMVFGDGDGVIFSDLSKSLDVIAHELTHGVTSSTANLEYHKQSGALNESVSDVFGSLVKQYFLGQTADKADWLIGADIFTPNIAADALRSLKAPGTAFDNKDFGKDQQPDHMKKFLNLPDTRPGDWGGVHYNSGIPNKAFYLTATGIGGNAWAAPGHIWYESLLASNEFTQFQGFADTTYAKAGQLYGTNGTEQKAVKDAWAQVGISITGAPVGMLAPEGDTLVALTDQIETLVAEIKKLELQVKALTPKKK